MLCLLGVAPPRSVGALADPGIGSLAGGVYIAASLLWLWAIEGVRPDRWDLAGATICLAGAAIILFGPRSA